MLALETLRFLIPWAKPTRFLPHASTFSYLKKSVCFVKRIQIIFKFCTKTRYTIEYQGVGEQVYVVRGRSTGQWISLPDVASLSSAYVFCRLNTETIANQSFDQYFLFNAWLSFIQILEKSQDRISSVDEFCEIKANIFIPLNRNCCRSANAVFYLQKMKNHIFH